MATWIMISLSFLLAGGLNALAGGGSFFTFPALLVMGMPAITANATSTVSLWFGSVASIRAYREELRTPEARQWIKYLLLPSMIGGWLGAEWLLFLPEEVFRRMLPFLLLIATIIFHGGPALRRYIATHSSSTRTLPTKWYWILFITLHCIVSLYGGFFGGGAGMMMLAIFSLSRMQNLYTMNALKVCFALTMNGTATLAFMIKGAVDWKVALPMAIVSMIGSYSAARVSRRIPVNRLRYFILIYGYAVSVWFLMA